MDVPILERSRGKVALLPDSSLFMEWRNEKYTTTTKCVFFSAQTILENCISCIMIHEISCITHSSRNELIHGVNGFFSTQPMTKKARMNWYTILESQYCLITSFLVPVVTEPIWSKNPCHHHLQIKWRKPFGVYVLSKEKTYSPGPISFLLLNPRTQSNADINFSPCFRCLRQIRAEFDLLPHCAPRLSPVCQSNHRPRFDRAKKVSVTSSSRILLPAREKTENAPR